MSPGGEDLQKRERRRIRTLPRLLAAGLVAVLLLSGFALIYDNSGIKETNPTGATATCWKGRQYVANMTEGFSWFVTDENGFNNASVPDEIDVLFTGDSHIEGAQLAQGDTAAAVLDRLLDGQNVYSIGITGNFLNFAVQNAENALETFHPKKAIILDVFGGTLYQDEADMRAIAAHEKERVPAMFESGPMYYIKQIPCVKPLLYGLRDWIAPPHYQTSPRPEVLTPEYLDALDAFLGVLGDAAKREGVTPIIVYHPEETIEPDGTIAYRKDAEYYGQFAAACEKNGIVLLDLTEDFRAFTAKEHVLMHGFSNTSAGDGHLNKYGHLVMAQALARTLKELEGQA